MEPSAGVGTAISAVRAVFTAYAGYEKGRIVDTDRGIREEVRRRATMVRQHLDGIHDTAHRERQRNLREAVKQAVEVLDAVADDAGTSVSAMPKSKHEAAHSLKKKDLKSLVQHDFDTLTRLVECTRSANEIADGQAKGQDESDLVSATKSLRQKAHGIRNHFRERNMILDGVASRRR